MTTTTATAAAAAATTVTDSVCRMCEGDTEKADRTDLLNEPTMWLGAQDGRYITHSSLCLHFTVICLVQNISVGFQQYSRGDI